MLFDLTPRVGAAHVDLARPLGARLLFRKIGADAKGRASPALARRAMTHPQKRGLAGRLRAQRAAAAMCDSGHSLANLPERSLRRRQSGADKLRFNFSSREAPCQASDGKPHLDKLL